MILMFQMVAIDEGISDSTVKYQPNNAMFHISEKESSCEDVEKEDCGLLE